MKKLLRQISFGLQTVLGLRKRGFFIPYRFAESIPADQPIYTELEQAFHAKHSEFKEFCQSLDQFEKGFKRFNLSEPPTPRWGQSWFPRLDGAATYGIVRMCRPKKIIEVGSGHSTRFMAQAIIDGGLSCHQVAIDPAPRASIKSLNVDWHDELLSEKHAADFAELDAGDIAFFDSSHILMPGTDVDMIFNRIIPTLKPGVLIHIHDIFLPLPYPENWLWRGYNEQNALGPMISCKRYELIFSSAYVANYMQAELSQTKLANIELFEDSPESSLWLRKG